ncbi:MAG TPA: tetraacyldisaccharide 4'-kinase [Thermoanaerobaculia bacterium]|jgi:tetraacyldisaccharide-1-P 4'-kinase/lauroyl/myristoyl acyltransferase
MILKLAELPYRAVNRIRRALYRAGVFQPQQLHKPVISIGNISAGGAGKTPAVIALARYLGERGHRVAVLTRGYGRADSSVSGPVTSLDAEKFGDEPVLIKKHLTNIAVLVGHNRYRNAYGFDTDLFILDDGFQHLQLDRDIDIVIDVPRPRFSREGRSALRDADFVIPRQLRTMIPEELRGKKVFAFAGLASNAQFFASLEGLEVIGTRGFEDHHRYTPADLAALRKAAGEATLVTTEKDWVKIQDPAIVAIGAEFVFEPGVLEQVVSIVEAAAPERRRKRRKNRLLQRVEYLAYRLAIRIVNSVSDERLLRWGTRFGAAARHVLRGRDRLAMRNLIAVFPDRDRRELRKTLDQCWRHFGREILLAIQTQNLSLEEIAARCPVVNRHILDEAIAYGKGVVLISAHWGGWEVAGLALMSLVQNVRTVARPLDNELLERDLQKIRARTGAEVIDRRKAARALLKGLSEKAVIVLLPDQAVQPREGVLVPFLGRPAWTTPAPAKMAVRAGATIVFGFCIPDGLRHQLVFQESIRVDDLSAEERDPTALTAQINRVISQRIIDRPELWLWMHDRWKGTGEGEATHAE